MATPAIAPPSAVSKVLAQAPILLAALGPIGAGLGLLGSGLLKGRLQDQEKAAFGQAAAAAAAPGQSPEAMRQGLMSLATQFPGHTQELGLMRDNWMAAQQQLDQERARRDQVDALNMGQQFALQRDDRNYGQQLGLEDLRNRRALEAGDTQFSRAQGLADTAYARQVERDRQAAQDARDAATTAWERSGQGMGLGAVPTGYTRRVAQDGSPVDIPNPGTEAYSKALEGVNNITGVLQNIQKMRELVGTHGTEYFGDSAQQMRTVSSSLINALGQLGNAGVLQPSDRDFYASLVPDPAGMMAQLNPMGASRIMASLGELERQIYQKGEAFREGTPWGLQHQALPVGEDLWQAAKGRAVVNSAAPPSVPPGYELIPGRQ